MSRRFVHKLLIALAALLGAIGGAAAGLLGPVLFNEAFGIRLSPEWRLLAGAIGFVVWPAVAGLATARWLNRERPIRRPPRQSPFDGRPASDLIRDALAARERAEAARQTETVAHAHKAEP